MRSDLMKPFVNGGRNVIDIEEPDTQSQHCRRN
jgi:hypothetical protein